jgi:hypothetical protein
MRGVFIQLELEEFLQANALVFPLPVERSEVEPPILLIIRACAIVDKDTGDIMQCVCQVEKFLLAKRLVVRAAAKKQEYLIEQIRIRSEHSVRRMMGFTLSLALRLNNQPLCPRQPLRP